MCAKWDDRGFSLCVSIEIHIYEFTATKKKATSGTFVDIYLFIYPFQMSSYCRVNICKDEIIRVVVFQVEKKKFSKKMLVSSRSRSASWKNVYCLHSDKKQWALRNNSIKERDT